MLSPFEIPAQCCILYTVFRKSVRQLISKTKQNMLQISFAKDLITWTTLYFMLKGIYIIL